MEAGGVGRGARIRDRRMRITWHANALAKRAGISRDTLARVEEDAEGVRPETYAKVERALDELSAELGFDEDELSGSLVRYEVKFPGGRALVVAGPVENIAELEESVARIMSMVPTDQTPVPESSVEP
jgi:transcriptional regulator with XRE-family HTH domain